MQRRVSVGGSRSHGRRTRGAGASSPSPLGRNSGRGSAAAPGLSIIFSYLSFSVLGFWVCETVNEFVLVCVPLLALCLSTLCYKPENQVEPV